MKKIAIFGTSADPPTIAHQSILQWLGDYFDLVLVYASDNPFKQHSSNIKHRSKMLQLLIDEIKSVNNNIKLCQEISDRRSLNTINKAREIWGDEVEFSLVIGSDLIIQINNWYKIEELFSKVELIILPRPGYVITREAIENLAKNGAKYQIAQVNLPAISSSEFRIKGQENNLTIPVRNYIKKQQLYQSIIS